MKHICTKTLKDRNGEIVIGEGDIVNVIINNSMGYFCGHLCSTKLINNHFTILDIVIGQRINELLLV